MSTASELLDFIQSSPSPFHTVKTVADLLRDAGFIGLTESEPFRLTAGQGYFVTRNGSSLIAFRIPENGRVPSFMIAAAHTDSPSFKITEPGGTEVAGFYTRIPVERYGGMLSATWFDRPLSAAGRVVAAEGEAIVPHTVDLDRDLFLIPSVAIHMNRQANENASYNAAVDLQPIAGSAAVRGELPKLLAEAAGVGTDNLLSYELYLYPRCRGTVWGIEDEFISAPRLDDLQCVFAALRGFLSAAPGEALPVLFLPDNEEVGSQTKQGAASPFLSDTLLSVIEALGGTAGDFRRAVAGGFMISADNAHAVHPNHPEYAASTHRPVMNGGIVIKHNAAQRYATDAISEAVFASLCRRAGVPVQHFVNRPDMAGGSTVGNISDTQVPICTVDIGLPQLAMHSCFETAGVKDTDYLAEAMKRFFSSRLVKSADGALSLL